MKKGNIQVSIITVNYRVENELINCISSILKSKPNVNFEIIVVDNNEKAEFGAVLKSKFPQVKYVKSEKNIGYGAASNLVMQFASGEYLFFLNPDTIVKENAVDVLYDFLEKNPKAGIIAPLLFDLSGKVYPNQGSDQYDFKSAFITSSFLNKLIPNNPISMKFFHKHWDKKNIEEFDVVPGTAFMIKKDLFKRIGLFDERFFLYFEEYDLGKKVQKLGYKNFILPNAKVLHVWEASTRKRGDIDKVFSKSRYLFFKKHYGVFFALIINFISNISKYNLILSLVLVLSAFLGFFKINQLMVFIGDQGWFYLSARDMLISGQIPLVGIASSHPWLHQGSLWTYLLALFLWIFKFNPVSGAYITIILGVLSVAGIYLVGKALFSKRVGIIASLLYATSPLVISYMRTPYHTSPIPFFVLIFIFSLYKFIQNKIIYLPIILLLLGILYSFEIATVILGGAFALVLIFKLFKKEVLIRDILRKKIATFSILALLISLFPMILYDVRNGFPQTIKFSVWLIYRLTALFQYGFRGVSSINNFNLMSNFLAVNFERLIFISSGAMTMIMLVALICWAIYFLMKGRGDSDSYNLIFLLFFLPVILIIVNQVPSDAYLPMLFPITILLIAIFFDYIMNSKRMFLPILLFIILLAIGNVCYAIKNNFIVNENLYVFTLEDRLLVSKQILNIAGNKDYNLIGKGPGSQFDSFTMNYEYLTWWLGHAPSKNNQKIKIYISESGKGIAIQKTND